MYSNRWQTGKSSGIKNVYPFTKPVPGSYCEAFLRAQEHLVHQRDNVSSDDTCSKTMFCNSLSSNASVEQNLTALDLSDDQNGVIYNRPKQSIHYIPYVKRQTKLKKVVASGVIVQGKKNFYGQIYKQKQTNIDTIESNNSHSLHLSNEECTNNSILPKTADLSSISVKENKRIDNRIDKNTCTLGNLLKEDIQKVPGTKKKKRTSGETSNSLRQDDKQTEIDNLIDKTNTLFVDENDIFALPRLFHFPNIAKHDVRDANDNTSISTLSSSTEDIKIACCEEEKKKRNRKVCNFPQKNDKQTDLKRDILENETHSTQLNNCNNDSPKIVNLPNINAVKHESTQDTNDKDISALQSSELMFFDIDYEFHEANHAIIQTFALNIYLFQCTNEKKTYCLVCDTTFQIPNKRSLQKILNKHIKSDDHVKLLSQMIEDDKKCLKAGKRFSKLGLAREYMRSKGDVIECLLCDSMNFVSKLQNDDLLIDEHISSSLHQNFKVSWKWPVKKILGDIKYRFRNMYNAKKYCCEFCKYENKSEIYFTKHLRVSYHTSRLAEIPDYAEIFKFHYCGACLLLWFGHSDMYERHCEQSEHKRKITYGVELDNLSEEVFQLLVMCNKNAETLLAQSNSVCNDQIIGYILWDLITDVQKSLPNVKAYPFGSRISDLAFSNSDIDIFLDYDDIYGKKLSHQDCQNLLTFIVNYLSLNKTMWKIQEMILNSRTPIIKVQHIPSKFICDISVTNGLAVENTKLIKCFNHAFSPCRKMVLFLKKWLNSCGLLHSNLITSYALTWCVIFYLQTLLVFPSISQLIKLKNSSWQIGGWEVGVSYDFPVKRINHTFEELLFGFFMFYANFTYKTRVICPLLGQPIKKSVFTDLSSLPPEMAPYIAYMRNACVQKKSQIFSISSLCVQDPFDLSHNLTKAMNNRKLNQFQSNCKYSAKILEKTFPNLKQPLSS